MERTQWQLDEAAWNEEAKCSLRSLSYDFMSRTGTIVVPEYCCTDMTGAINIVLRIDPEAVMVRVFAGDELDSVYEITRHGWVCRDMRPTGQIGGVQ